MDDKIIRKIYASITDDSVWPELMRDLEGTVGGYSSALMIATPQRNWMHQTNMDPEIVEAYNGQYENKDLWIERAERTQIGEVVGGLMSLADHTEFDAGYLNDILKASDCLDAMSTKLFDSPERQGAFSIYRDYSKEAFQPSDIERMSIYAQHLIHAVSLRSEFASLSTEMAQLQGALEQIPEPLLLLREDASVAWANTLAENELSNQSTVKLRNGRLTIRNSPYSSRLTSILRAVFQTGQAATLPIGINEDSSCHVLHLTRLTEDVSDTAAQFSLPKTSGTFVLAKLKRPQSVSRQAKAALKSVYDLTDRQVDITTMLADGLTITDIAKRGSISLGTTRNHIKATFGKTGTSRQAELVRLVLSL